MPRGWAVWKGGTRPRAAAWMSLRSLRTCSRLQTQLHAKERGQQFVRVACGFHSESVQDCHSSSYSWKVRRGGRHCGKLGEIKNITGQEWVPGTWSSKSCLLVPDPSCESMHQSCTSSVTLVKHKRRRDKKVPEEWIRAGTRERSLPQNAGLQWSGDIDPRELSVSIQGHTISEDNVVAQRQSTEKLVHLIASNKKQNKTFLSGNSQQNWWLWFERGLLQSLWLNTIPTVLG